jgi:hypothetical protein
VVERLSRVVPDDIREWLDFMRLPFGHVRPYEKGVGLENLGSVLAESQACHGFNLFGG